jgi:hypothetical protein
LTLLVLLLPVVVVLLLLLVAVLLSLRRSTGAFVAVREHNARDHAPGATQLRSLRLRRLVLLLQLVIQFLPQPLPVVVLLMMLSFRDSFWRMRS